MGSYEGLKSLDGATTVVDGEYRAKLTDVSGGGTVTAIFFGGY